MAGNTGRMTAEAVEARGPRMILWSIYPRLNHKRRIGFAITREGELPVRFTHFAYRYARRYATSYSLSYLMRLARAAEKG